METSVKAQHTSPGWALLAEAFQAILTPSSVKEMMPRLLERALEVTGGERGFILIRDEQGSLKPALSQGVEPGTLAPGDPSHTVIEQALRLGRPVISRNAVRDPRFKGSESLIIQGIRHICCIPLIARGEKVGAIYVDAISGSKLKDEDLPILEAFGTLSALALANMMELEARRIQPSPSFGHQSPFPLLVGESRVMQELYQKMAKIAEVDLPVLIVGESGTGKELVARSIHQASPRKEKAWRAIFCGNLTSELLESELFGYKKGAFTGAITDKPGLLDLTNGGTLFLDEVADIPAPIQTKLLRFLQEGEYFRLGDPQPRHADVRIISATNKNIEREIAEGRFREDLYYRLNVLRLEVPPLRDREGDIELLSLYILQKIALRTGQSFKRLSRSALSALNHYSWPGNVRQLENILARAAVLAQSDVIEREDLDIPLPETPARNHDEPLDLESAVRAHILKVLKLTSGNRSEAARLLGVSRRFLQKELARWKVGEEKS